VTRRPGGDARDARLHHRRERGQATVELALLLPVIVMLLLLVVQMLVVGRDYVVTIHAAREAARAESVDPTGRDATAVVARTLPGAHLVLVPRARVGDPVRAIVRYTVHTDVPLVGPLLPDVDVHATVTMRSER
jgi:TadE-like protein